MRFRFDWRCVEEGECEADAIESACCLVVIELSSLLGSPFEVGDNFFSTSGSTGGSGVRGFLSPESSVTLPGLGAFILRATELLRAIMA